MKRVIFSFVVVAAIAVSAVAVTSCGNAQAQGGGRATIERWEYKVANFDGINPSEFEVELNRLGLEGWELISVPAKSSGGYYYDACLKRKLP